MVKLLLQAFEKIQELETELEKLKRKQARQAAPFSRNIPKENPKRPGRIAGQGKFSYKTAPQATEITEVVEVPLAQQSCPKCGLELEVSPSAIRVAYNLEMPKVMAQITEYRLEVRLALEGLVDLGEYLTRAKKKQLELEKQVQQAKGKLSNDNFVKNAPEEVLLEERRRIEDFGARLERLGAVLAQFA